MNELVLAALGALSLALACLLVALKIAYFVVRRAMKRPDMTISFVDARIRKAAASPAA
jgi:hypothetical protein